MGQSTLIFLIFCVVLFVLFFCVLYSQCYNGLWIVIPRFRLEFVILIFLVFCVVLFVLFFCVLYSQCCSGLWIVIPRFRLEFVILIFLVFYVVLFVLCVIVHSLVFPMLQLSLDCNPPDLGGVCDAHLFSFLCYVFSSPDPKGHVSYSHHLASVVVVRPSSVVRRPSYVVNFFKNLLLWKY